MAFDDMMQAKQRLEHMELVPCAAQTAPPPQAHAHTISHSQEANSKKEGKGLGPGPAHLIRVSVLGPWLDGTPEAPWPPLEPMLKEPLASSPVALAL